MTSIFTDLHCCDAFMGVHVCQNLTKLCTLIMFRLLYTNYTLIKNCLKKSQWGLLWNPSSPMKKPFTMALSVPTYSCRVCQQWEALIALYPGHLSVAKFASVASSLERWSNFFSTQRAGLLTAYSKSGRFSQLKRDKLTAYLPLNCVSLWDMEVWGAKKQRCQCSRSLVCWVIKSFCSDPGVLCLLTISRALWQATLSK